MSSKTKITATKEEPTPALVPKLRFPEFRGAEGWESTRLGDLCEVITKGSTPTSYGFDYVDAGVRFVKIESLGGGSVDCGKTAFITEDCNTSFLRSQLKENDILFSIAGALGVIALVGRSILPANVNQAIGIVRLKPGYSHQFLLHQLQGDLIQAEIQRIRAGAAQPNISLTQLGDFAALLPDKAEQQKIAECLSSVDELMAAQARKVDALKTHKKGLMQQLFPRAGETQPRLRFPEFQTAGEWEEVKLDHLVHFQDGFAFKSTDFVKAQEDATQVIRITDINNKNTNEDKVFISTAFLEQNKLGKYRVDDGDLLLSLTGAAGFNFFFWNGGPAAINQRTAKVTAKKESGHALLRLLDPLIHEKINERGEGQNNNLSKEFLGTIILRVPDSAEQQRIADCLSSLDALITAETQRFSALKTHKKGLMQQLFPSLEEVEG